MTERVNNELELLKSKYPDLVFIEEGMWVKILNYPVPPGWNREKTDIVFQIPVQYPGSNPYAFFVLSGMQYNGTKPVNNYTEPSDVKPAFDGNWGKFSWLPDDGEWRPTADIHSGSNLYNWVEGFRIRFKEGL